MDIKPPRSRSPQIPPSKPVSGPLRPIAPTAPQPITDQPSGLNVTPPKKSRLKKILLIASGAVVAILLGLLVGGWLWYQAQLSPLGGNENEKVKVVIASGSAPSAIGEQLEEQKVIRSSQAFDIYTRLSGTQNSLQAGTYRLSPAESTPEIVEHLTNGNVDTFSITFLPGATLKQNRTVLIDAGYTEEEVDAGLNATYDSPLFTDKPANTDLEGYIYGETYQFGSGATVEEILEYTFEVFYGVIEENDLVAKFQTHGLNLYQGITLASIVQRESVGGDEADIAQVFYNRMAAGMTLGSDVTYQYIADKTGVPRDPNLDSPYNTRRHTGLPPGPIATPGLAALKGVATPNPSDYLYFLSGDDDVTYFGRTNEEHEQNIIDHCQEKCQIL